MIVIVILIVIVVIIIVILIVIVVTIGQNEGAAGAHGLPPCSALYRCQVLMSNLVVASDSRRPTPRGCIVYTWALREPLWRLSICYIATWTFWESCMAHSTWTSSCCSTLPGPTVVWPATATFAYPWGSNPMNITYIGPETL